MLMIHLFDQMALRSLGGPKMTPEDGGLDGQDLWGYQGDCHIKEDQPNECVHSTTVASTLQSPEGAWSLFKR